VMEFDAFISYSSTDKTAAFAVCAVLERAGIRCWIAPRDITPGGEYGAAIIDAIEQCRVMVLIFSSSANNSRQISREIERAVSKSVPVVPVRIENVVPTKSMEYFLGAIHWLDALTPPIEKHLEHLAETVKAILHVEDAARATSSNFTGGDKTDLPATGKSGLSARSERTEGNTGVASPKTSGRPNWVLAMLGIGACTVALLGGVWLYKARSPAPASPPTALASPPSTPNPSPPEPARKQAALLVPENVPFVPERERSTIRSEYLAAPDHKALAISFNRSGFITGQQDDETAKAAALENCKRATEATGTKNPCYLYAVGNTIVFTGGNPPMPPAPWFIRNPAIERPFAGKDLPLASDSTREYWERTYPKAGTPKALALSPAGRGFYYTKVASTDEGIRRALESCGYLAGVPCLIVAVDDSFVVPIPTTMKVTGFFHLSSNTMMSPEARDTLVRRFGNATNAWNGVAVGATGRAGFILNAANEQDAIDGALADCNKQDRDCRVVSLGPFLVERINSSR